jgi:hypothetical protein
MHRIVYCTFSLLLGVSLLIIPFYNYKKYRAELISSGLEEHQKKYRILSIIAGCIFIALSILGLMRIRLY